MKIQEQLHERHAKHSFSTAKKLLAQGQAKAAAALIDEVGANSLTPEREKFRKELAEIVFSENELLAIVKEARTGGVIDSQEFFELLPKAEAYLKLNPNHGGVQKLHADLLLRLTKLPASELATLPKSFIANLPAHILEALPASVLTPLPTSVLVNLPSSVLRELPISVLTALPALAVLNLPPRTNSIGMKLKLIPGGRFTMGSESGGSNEQPAHKVLLTKAFELGVYQVTQAQFERVMGKNPSSFLSHSSPVDNVDWNDAVAFCRLLSARPLERAAGRVYRLPTEAEWEYACRAGTTTEYSFGEDESSLGDYAWYKSNSDSHTHPVGQKKPNPWGLYDMHGNAWEWCGDGYGNYPHESVTDPIGSSRDGIGIVRGGSCHAAGCRSAYRVRAETSFRVCGFGFRVACVPSGR